MRRGEIIRLYISAHADVGPFQKYLILNHNLLLFGFPFLSVFLFSEVFERKHNVIFVRDKLKNLEARLIF